MQEENEPVGVGEVSSLMEGREMDSPMGEDHVHVATKTTNILEQQEEKTQSKSRKEDATQEKTWRGWDKGGGEQDMAAHEPWDEE